MASDTDNTQYSMLVDIAKSIGELQSDVKSTKKEITELDRTFTAKLAELFDATTKKQEFLRDSIEAELGGYRAEIKTLKARIENLEERTKKLEESPKNKLFELFEKFKGLLLMAILTALVGWCMSFMKDLTTAVRTPPPPIEMQNKE
jgi:chromosome segregation ATPase